LNYFSIKNKYLKYFPFDLQTDYGLSKLTLSGFELEYHFKIYKEDEYKREIMNFISNGLHINTRYYARAIIHHNKENPICKLSMVFFPPENSNKISDSFIFKLHIVEILYRTVLKIEGGRERDNFMNPFDSGSSMFFGRVS
jgi:hypothetical protein